MRPLKAHLSCSCRPVIGRFIRPHLRAKHFLRTGAQCGFQKTYRIGYFGIFYLSKSYGAICILLQGG